MLKNVVFSHFFYQKGQSPANSWGKGKAAAPHPLRTIHEVTFMKLKKSPRISTDFPRIYTD